MRRAASDTIAQDTRLFRCLNPLRDSRAAEQVARARALVTESPDESREAIILVEVAELRRLGRDPGGAIEAAERALALATKTDQPRLVAPAHFQLGVAHLTRGAYGEGIAHLKATVARLANAPLRDRLGYPYIPALCRLSWSFADLGELDEAWRYAEEARRLAETTEHVLTLAEASTAIGVLHLAQDRPADAIPPQERASDLARTWTIAYIPSFRLSWLALAYARCGRRDEAQSLLDECERERVWERVRLQWSRIVVRLGQARLLLGDAPSAHALADQSLSLARSIGEPAGEAEALALLAEVALHSGPAGALEAMRHLAEAAGIAERVGLHPLRARLQLLVAVGQAGK